MRAAFLSIGIVLAALVGLLVLEGDDSPATPPARPAASVATITGRVEALRGLRFDSRPVPQRVSPAQARREGLEDLDRAYPEARRKADEEVLKLLGLIEPDVDLRSISSSVFGEGVAGYYDPRSKRLRIVSGATPDALGEMVLAHELTHALEDQRFGLALEEGETDDAALARLALVEGSAMLVMQQYLLRHIGTEQALSGLLGSALQTGPELPPFLEQQLIFPYLSGLEFVSALQRGGRRDVEARRPGRPRARAGEHRAGPASGEVGGRREPAPGAARRRAGRRLATHRPRDLGRVADPGAARVQRRCRRRGVGRGPLRALAAGGVRRGAVPRHRRARDEVALGHAGGRARVRGRPARLAGRERCRRGASGDTVTLVLAGDAALARRIASANS